MNDIQWKQKALKQMRKIPAQQGAAIRQAVNTELLDLTAARNVSALKDHEYSYRLRVGDYRVLFDYEGGTVCVVTIEEVRKRDGRTY